MIKLNTIGNRLNQFDNGITNVENFNNIFPDFKITGHKQDEDVELGEIITTTLRVLYIGGEPFIHKFERSFQSEYQNPAIPEDENDYEEYNLLF